MADTFDLNIAETYQEAATTVIRKATGLVILMEQIIGECPLCGGSELGTTGLRLKHKKTCPIMETLRDIREVADTLEISNLLPPSELDYPEPTRYKPEPVPVRRIDGSR